jgi:hypothetical protein
MNAMSIEATINRMKQFFGIDCEVSKLPFTDWASLPKTMRGVYVLTDEQGQTIYVGKGFVRSRQDTHWAKANGIVKSNVVDTKGWQWLREHVQITPSQWTLNYIALARETELSAMEGGLIHLLQPLANDETFKDR